MRNETTQGGSWKTPVTACAAEQERILFAADLRLLAMGLTIAAGLHGFGVRGGYIALTVLVMPLAVFLAFGYIAGRAGMVGTLAMAMGVSLLANPSPLDVGTYGAMPELLVLAFVGMLAMMGSSWAEDLRPAPQVLARESLQASRRFERWSRVDIQPLDATAVTGPMGLSASPFPEERRAEGRSGGPRYGRRELDRVRTGLDDLEG